MVVRRPRDRKQQILAAAGELFREHGYHNVSVAQVAAAVGITAPALYRHFKNKPDPSTPRSTQASNRSTIGSQVPRI